MPADAIEQANIGNLRRLLVLIVLLIVYGSLYPWRFAPRAVPGNPFLILLHAWGADAGRFFVRDVVINIAIYVPFGMLAYLVLRPRAPAWQAFTAPVLFGLLLSCSMELAQLFEPIRRTSALDVVTNTIGSALGVGLGVAFEETALAADARLKAFHPADRGAVIMIFFWIAWLTFPFFPLTGLHAPRHKMEVFISSGAFAIVPFLSAAAAWFAAGRLLAATEFRSARLWLGLSLLAIPAQILIVDRQPVPSDILGAGVGVLIFAFGEFKGGTTAAGAWVFLGVLISRGLSPFHFAASSSTFDWIPFDAVLSDEWQRGLFVLIEKCWFYGVAIWLLRARGIRLAPACLIVTITLAAIEVIQLRLPGRTPEITDPILAILLAFGLRILSAGRARGVA